jgi:hypothetical protein
MLHDHQPYPAVEFSHHFQLELIFQFCAGHVSHYVPNTSPILTHFDLITTLQGRRPEAWGMRG